MRGFPVSTNTRDGGVSGVDSRQPNNRQSSMNSTESQRSASSSCRVFECHLSNHDRRIDIQTGRRNSSSPRQPKMDYDSCPQASQAWSLLLLLKRGQSHSPRWLFANDRLSGNARQDDVHHPTRFSVVFQPKSRCTVGLGVRIRRPSVQKRQSHRRRGKVHNLLDSKMHDLPDRWPRVRSSTPYGVFPVRRIPG